MSFLTKLIEFIKSILKIKDEVDNDHDETNPEPTPEPTTDVGPVFYAEQKNSELPLGVCLATENYVPGGKDKGSSISVDHIMVKNSWNPVKYVKKDYTQLILKSPTDKRPDCNNWNLSAGQGYTTRHAVNPDTGVLTPADGTWRGIATLGFARTGAWDVYVKGKCTPNRGTAYVGITIQDGATKTTFWHKWYQRREPSKHLEFCVGKKIKFATK